MGWVAALTRWILGSVVAYARAARWLRVEALDVGHGECLLVRTPRRHMILIDAGSQEASRSRVVPLLRARGISRVDVLVLTHTDEDHLGGAIPLLGAVRFRQLWTN